MLIDATRKNPSVSFSVNHWKRGMHRLPSRHETPTVKLSASQESSSTRPEIIPPTPVQLGVVEPGEAFCT